MNLLGYNAGSHNSAIEAQAQGALHHLTILNDIDDATLTLKDLHNPDLMTELNNAWQFANNAFGIMGHKGEIVAVLEDIDGNLVYEMAKDGSWVKIQTLTELIDAQLKNIEKWGGEAYQSPACKATEGQGDEIWQSLYEIRKIIGIGTSDYTKELEDAKNN